MSRKKAKVWIVTMPGGSIVEAGLSRVSADHALAKALQEWLLPDIFGNIEWGGRHSYGALARLWPAMEKQGWRVHEIEPFGLPVSEQSQ